MMNKMIVTTKGAEMMNFEEVLKAYRAFAMKCLRTHKNGGMITEDDEQEIDIVIFKAFKDYNEVNCFSTHLTWKLRQYFTHTTINAKKEKRDDSKFEMINLDMTIGKDGHQEQSFHELLMDPTASFETRIQDKDFLSYIANNVTDIEMKLLAVLLGKIKPIELAEMENTSKQNINGKVKRFKAKLVDLIADYNK